MAELNTQISPRAPLATLLVVVSVFGSITWAGAQTESPAPSGLVKIEVALLRDGEKLPGDDSVTWIAGMRATPHSAEHVKIAQNDKQFEPRITAVSVGSTVDFPNHDRVFHNVFSLSSAKPFDLGLYRKGKSKAVRFDQPGLVQIYCNIHPHMAAYLMIVDSSRHEVADASGTMTFTEVPAGRLTVEGWNLRGGSWIREIFVEPHTATAVSVELEISSWRDTSHLNKHGKEYPPPDDDDFRY